MPRFKVDAPDVPLTLNLRQYDRQWDAKQQLKTISEGHYGHRAEPAFDRDRLFRRLEMSSHVRYFDKTHGKYRNINSVSGPQRALLGGRAMAEDRFKWFVSNVDVMANISPYDYRLVVCNAIPHLPLRYNITLNHDQDVRLLGSTACWIRMTELIDGLIGERLDPDYMRYLDREMLKVRLRRVGAYAELLYAYDYSTVLDTVYPVNDPKRWQSYPRSWGELMFCCLWRREQSQFFKRITHQEITDEHGNTPTVPRTFYW